jgi:hypothetical protein
MIPLFLGLSAANLLCLTVTLALGYAVSFAGTQWATYHQLAGILATIVCCGVHCVVFTYFIATAKWVQHAIAVKHLDAGLAAPTRSFKAQAFPAALIAMASVCLAAFVGAASVGYALRPIYHHVAALVALGANVIVLLVEHRAIRRNGRLIDDVLARVSTADALHPAAV